MPTSLCLNMIVKNEAHVIARCLDSVSPWISHWTIVDTGSSDGTRELVRARLAGGLSRSDVTSAAVVAAAAAAAGRGRTKPEACGIKRAATTDINDSKVLVSNSSPKPRVTSVTMRVESQ